MNEFFVWFDNLPDRYFIYGLMFFMGYILRDFFKRK